MFARRIFEFGRGLLRPRARLYTTVAQSSTYSYATAAQSSTYSDLMLGALLEGGKLEIPPPYASLSSNLVTAAALGQVLRGRFGNSSSGGGAGHSSGGDSDSSDDESEFCELSLAQRGDAFLESLFTVTVLQAISFATSRFVRGLVKAELPKDYYARWSKEDLSYLDAFSTAMENVIDKLKAAHKKEKGSERDREVYEPLLDFLRREREQVNKESAIQRDIMTKDVRRWPVTRDMNLAAYSRHLINTTERGDLHQAVWALVACYRRFAEMGVAFRLEDRELDDIFYAHDLMEFYQSDEYIGRADYFVICAARLVSNERECFESGKVFSQSSYLETAFSNVVHPSENDIPETHRPEALEAIFELTRRAMHSAFIKGQPVKPLLHPGHPHWRSHFWLTAPKLLEVVHAHEAEADSIPTMTP